MNATFRLILAVAVGAVAMYYLDPATGRRRRALARDQGVAAGHQAGEFVRVKSKRAADRMRGVAARTRSRIFPEPVEDDQLHERIRAKLGHLVAHPGAVKVEVHEGRVVLSGTAAAKEIEELTAAVAAMQGIEAIDNRLTLTAEGGKEPPPSREVRH